MKYYLIENSEKSGPFSIEDLEKKEIYKDTLVWAKGMDDWTKASNIPMLKDIIDQTPPPFNNTSQKSETPPPPPNSNKAIDNYFGYKLATKGERFLACLIGSIIILIPIALLTKGEAYRSDNYFSGYDYMVSMVSAIIIGGLMYPLWSGNIGHKIFGIKVISKETGEDVNKSLDGILREVFKNVLGYLIVPIIWLLWDKDNQNLYDKISKTIVVKTKKN